jgi:hypothetical protein
MMTVEVTNMNTTKYKATADRTNDQAENLLEIWAAALDLNAGTETLRRRVLALSNEPTQLAAILGLAAMKIAHRSSVLGCRFAEDLVKITAPAPKQNTLATPVGALRIGDVITVWSSSRGSVTGAVTSLVPDEAQPDLVAITLEDGHTLLRKPNHKVARHTTCDVWGYGGTHCPHCGQPEGQCTELCRSC